MGKQVLFLDTETTGAQNLYNQTPREQFRLGQWAWGRDGEISLTDSYDEMMEQVNRADMLVGHNLFYDTRVLFGKDSIRPLELALERRLICTFTLYPVKFRIPVTYETADGKRATTYQEGKQKPELTKRFLSLDNLTHHHGLPGKSGNLKELAKKYNPKGTLMKDLDFGLIPTDDPEFREYAYNDIVALQALASWMLDTSGSFTEVDYREMLIAAINDQISANGITVDQKLAGARVKELHDERDRIMDWLVRDFDMPPISEKSKQPWKSSAGKGAIIKAFESFGIVPEGNDTWTRSEKTGAPSFSKETLLAISEGTEAETLARGLATLQGQRSLAELALDSTWNDGKAHPQITSLQRSGRFSMTNPSLPIWGSRTDELAKEKEYFIASPGCKLVEMDYSNADQRIVAALSGDAEYAKRFEPGVDGHEVSGRLMFGDEAYDEDPKAKRHIAKALSHAYAYGAGAKTLARTSKLPESDDPEMEPLYLARKFIDAMDSAYPWNKKWREWAYQQGETGWVTDLSGRKLAVDPERAYTMGPGLLGQAGTRYVLCTGLIRIASESLQVIRWLVAHVHDAVIWDIPEEHLEWAVPWIKERLEVVVDPGTLISQPIFFPVSTGEPADDWMRAGHG